MGGRLLSCLAVATLAAPASATPARPLAVALPAAPLGRSLMEVSRLSGIEIAFADAAAARLRAPAVTGSYTLSALLDTLTVRSGARYRYVTASTIIVERAPGQRRRPAPPRPDFETAETIIVSASKREQPLLDVPMAAASYAQVTLDRMGINDTRAITRITPGVLMRNTWGGSTNLSMRGVFSTSGSATVGVYIDDTPIQTRSLGAGVTSTNIYPALFDLERVEVLHGPQGALYGSGSEGGTIRFITREPDLTHMSGMASAETFSTRAGAGGYEVSAALGGPLIADQLGFRMAGFVRREGGWVDRATYPDNALVDQNINRQTSAGVRAAVAAQVSDTVRVTPSIFYQRWSQRDLDHYWSLLSDPDADRFRSGSRVRQGATDRFLLANLKVEAEFSGADLLANTSYFHRRRPSVVDYTHYLVEMLTSAAQFTVPGVSDYSVPVDFENNQDVFTQEVRMTGPADGTVRWVAGAFLQRAQQDAIEYINEPLLDDALTALIGQTSASFFGSDLLPGGISYVGIDRSVDWQAAVFGQADVALLPTVDMTIGGRIARMHYSQTNFQDGPRNTGPSRAKVSAGENAFLPRLGLSWRPAKGRLFYVSAAKGTRIGGANPPVNARLCEPVLNALGFDQVPDRYDADEIWSYEVGAKLKIPAVNGSIQTAAYHFRWDDIQQSISLRCLFRYTGNAARASGDGAEISVNLAPWPGFSMTMTAAYADARYTDTSYGGVIDVETGERSVVIPAGQRLPSPRWRLTGFVQYERVLRDGLSAYATANGDYAAAYPQGYAPGAVSYDEKTYISPSVMTVRAQAGVRMRGWDLSAYVENLFDSRDALEVTHNSRRSINTRYTILRPRTVGVRAVRSFD